LVSRSRGGPGKKLGHGLADEAAGSVKTNREFLHHHIRHASTPLSFFPKSKTIESSAPPIVKGRP